MKVCGFTFIRNALKYDYPILEAIQSILPICDHLVVAVGQSEDDTLDLIQNIPSDKIEIIETIWDDSQREGGRVLAEETNKAFQAISTDYDWCFYIQGDEVIHQKYLPTIRKAMTDYLDNHVVEGLLLGYTHFYGSYDYIATSSNWYKNEIRIIRNNKKIFSYQDAQGFRCYPNRKLNVISVDAAVYHYGWVKDPRAMQAKQENFNKYWHDDSWINDNVAQVEQFDYSEIDQLTRFVGDHPQVMKERIARINWQFDFDPSTNCMTFKQKLKFWSRKYLGYEIGEYRNYKLIK